LLTGLRTRVDDLLPRGTTGRKVLDILSVVLVVEGLFSIILFSYVGFFVGLSSLVLGMLLITVSREGEATKPKEEDPPGLKLVDYLVRLVGGEKVVMALGFVVILAVMVYNLYISARPELGDVDTISLMFGFLLLVYPLLADKYKVEVTFALVFVAFVVVFLVVPQVVMSVTSSGGDSAVGNWYVHYMLAEPFAGILDLIGIPTSSSGNMVTIQFQDGTMHTLAISAYCAGLYSFSIFLAAFMAFVLVFERLPPKVLAVVLALGLLVAYLGNILRMVVIGVVGYFEGIEALHWTHENVGWMIFLAWSAVFWWVILGLASRNRPVRDA
jgi:archaeosortase C (PEF-CTERM variant)